MKKIQLGVLALIALGAGISAFSSSIKVANANNGNHSKAVFTYWVYATLTGIMQNNTRVVTVTPTICTGTIRDCKIVTNTEAIITIGGKKLVADGTFTVLSKRF